MMGDEGLLIKREHEADTSTYRPEENKRRRKSNVRMQEEVIKQDIQLDESSGGAGKSGGLTECNGRAKDTLAELLSWREEIHADQVESVDQPVKSKGKRAAKAAEANVEKRDKRFRIKAPQATLQRAERVKAQRMFMLDRQKLDDLQEKFQVLGSTGNVYTVMIEAQPSCDCPDFQKGNAPCKHVIFVFLKVLKVPEDSSLWFQRSLLTGELRTIFSAAPLSPTDTVSVSLTVRNAYLKATGLPGAAGGQDIADGEDSEVDSAPIRKIISVGEDCPVCYEEMTEEDDRKKRLVYDDAPQGCGKALHKICFNTWANTRRDRGGVTCVWCRGVWPSAAGTQITSGSVGVQVTASGYLNMADIAGISRIRDTSTYHFPWRRTYHEDR
ncbi:hypothetical protein BD324DRAFT_615627 [Kockovaella imperatae]|uniref:SWIM-type domain-containing protein n=1 Tax=Kockovaella imperatae TaxID=4999 RepID=A0A1Y1UPJ1_9TREE|nr:hypothetical protein BD324DRAFT_615627 [Kockovaella imperatae]ORX39951.1 hypothetical protein BD324DRAFT_615627 [Kockovaella imperatae]